MSTPGPSPTAFRPRQTSYLRISPTSVLQMILYLELHHTHWMNVRLPPPSPTLHSCALDPAHTRRERPQNSVLERMLFALRDRIPLKLATEGDGKKHGKEKTHVDVFRGADYQMAFFFRRASDKHVVLLKDKNLHYATRSPRAQPPPPPPQPQPARASKRRRASPSPSRDPSAAPRVDLRNSPDDEQEGSMPPPAKRTTRSQRGGEGEGEGVGEAEVLVVKDEPEDEGFPLGLGYEAGGMEGEEAKPEVDEDVKPVLKVNYQGYRIFGRTLVVIVEPYPPLSASDLARPNLLQTEIRQLSASVAPSSYRGSASVAAQGRGYRGGTLSATPVPLAGRSRGEMLFRREEGSETPGLTPSPRGGGGAGAGEAEGEGEGGEEDGQLRRLREDTQLLANEFDAVDDMADDADELPSLDAVLAKRSARGAAAVVEKGADEEGEADEHA
ncbi:hypothetical protein JCM10207_005691 [Rhodosporidiobolus poonsookiae]